MAVIEIGRGLNVKIEDLLLFRDWPGFFLGYFH